MSEQSLIHPSRPGGQRSVADSPPVEIDTCWNRIGVHGDSSCPELQNFVHCRNCPVYSNAGVQLLDRPLPEQYRREWTEHFAQEKKAAEPAKGSALLFRLHTEWLALATQAFQEAAERRLIHSLPHRRSGLVLGLVNIRGELLICVSLSRLLGLERTAARGTEEMCIVESAEWLVNPERKFECIAISQ